LLEFSQNQLFDLRCIAVVKTGAVVSQTTQAAIDRAPMTSPRIAVRKWRLPRFGL
jgi:hypothetical protein